MRSPPSRTRSMTNWPGWADFAISGASSRNNLVTGVSRRVSRIFAIRVSSGLQQGMLVHRLGSLPAAIDFVLDSLQDRRIGRLHQVLGLAHELQPVGNGLAPSGGFRV